MLADLAQNAAGIAHSNHVGGDVFGNYAAAADYRIVTNGNTGQDDGICADPAIALHKYRYRPPWSD